MRRLSLIRSLVAAFALVGFQFGCDSKPKTPPPGGGHSHAGHSHSHGELPPGPHKGKLLELEYKEHHVEMVIDHAAKKVTLYVFGEDMKTPAPIKPENGYASITVSKPESASITLTAKPLEGEKDGASSVFVGEGDVLAKEDLQGFITTKLDGKDYQVDFKDEDHDHDHKDEAKDKK